MRRYHAQENPRNSSGGRRCSEVFGGGQRCPPKIAQCHWSGKSRPSSCSCWTAVQSLWVSYAVISFCLRKNFQYNFYLLQNLSTMGNAYSTVAGGFTNVTVHFPTLAGGVGGLFVVVAIIGASVWCLRRNKKGRGMPHHQVKIQFLNEHV